MALGLHDPQDEKRWIRIYNNLHCNYSEAMYFKQITGHYCNNIETIFDAKLCFYVNNADKLESEYNENLGKSYEEVGLALTNDDRILNMAMTTDLIAFTTANKPRGIHLLYKELNDDKWLSDFISYAEEETEYVIF